MAPAELGYGLTVTSEDAFATAVERVKDQLRAESFTVLCEVDVKERLDEALRTEREPYMIIGACNSTLAQAALMSDMNLGVFLPCSVVVYESDGVTHITTVDTVELFRDSGDGNLALVAAEMRARLARAIDAAAA